MFNRGEMVSITDVTNFIFKTWKRLYAGTVPANKEYAAGTVPANKKYAAGTVPANKKYASGTPKVFKNIKNCEGGGCKFDFCFFSLLYGTPANIARKPATGGMASQHLRTFERIPANKI